LYVVGSFNAGSSRVLLHKSSDGGSNWNRVEGSLGANITGFEIARISVNASGVVYLAGKIKTSGVGESWSVLKTADLGQSWASADDLRSSGENIEVVDMLDAGSGTLFVIGNITWPDVSRRWIIRKSADSGATWTTVDEYTHPSGRLQIKSIAKGVGGVFYASGSWTDSANTDHVFVRKTSNFGTSWTTVYDAPSAELGGNPTLVVDAGTGKVILADSLLSAVDTTLVTRRSDDGGVNWNTSTSTFAASPWTKLRTLLITATSSIFWFGEDVTATSYAEKWTLRRSDDLGATWNAVSSTSPGGYFPIRLDIDGSGNQYALGEQGISEINWTLRKSVDGGVNWTTADEFKDSVGAAQSSACNDVNI
jgi:hypothetical protein